MAGVDNINVQTIETQAEAKVQEWRRSKSSATKLKTELLDLICNKTFHSAKLMRLYAEVLLRNAELEEGYAAFDTYVSVQKLSLIKARSGARSHPDSVETGTFDIFKLVLQILEHQGINVEKRCANLEKQLTEILESANSEVDNNNDSESSKSENKEEESPQIAPEHVQLAAPLYARLSVAQLLAVNDDSGFEKYSNKARTWFERAGSSDLDADTYYKQGLYFALVQGPEPAFQAIRAALKYDPDHLRSALLMAQLLSAKQQRPAALQFTVAYLERKPSPRSIVDKIALLRLKKTHIALLEALHGPEAALNELTEFIDLLSVQFALNSTKGQALISRAANGSGAAQNGTSASASASARVNGNGRSNGVTNGVVNGASRGAASSASHEPKKSHRIFSFRSHKTMPTSMVGSTLTPTEDGVSKEQLAKLDSKIVAFNWFWVAQQYGKAGLDAEAKEAIKEGLSFLPGNDELDAVAQSQALLGQLQHSQDPARALKYYLEALETDSLNITAAIGAAMILTDDTTESKQEELLTFISGLLGAISLRTPGRYIPEVWYFRGLISEKYGVKSEARSMYWKAVELEERRGVTSYAFTADAALS